ncbi:JmjC domain-containing protein [Pseudomonas aeruginosa]|uniref:JmjC domain-containing protein n=1 Tax=Pseudomonas aeruginosa TaxID=287 RepID=UPI0009BC638D|nr:cupin domain-containing protein [Pseudomonas aeruginosa]
MRDFGDTAGFGSKLLDGQWRKKPVVGRKIISSKFIRNFNEERFLKWTDRTSGSVRLFDSHANGDALSGLLTNAKLVRSYFEKIRELKSALTFHMNDVELVDQDIFELRQSFEIPFWWRLDDIIATLSTPESGIGYHAGHEDGIIVQLYGSRRWCVWAETCTPTNYRYQLLAPGEGPNPRISRPKSKCDMLLDVHLSPGDVLYIPPFFPHEGVTTDTSVSLSIAWKGIGPASFLPKSLFENIESSRKTETLTKATLLFDESLAASEAIQLWKNQSLRIIPEDLRERYQSLIHESIKDHVLYLAQRYCN